jgi:O-antigen ligase
MMLFPVYFTESRATKMAFGLGMGVILLAARFPNFTRRLLAGILCTMMTLPFIITHIFLNAPQWIAQLPPSWHHRVEIWDYMSYRIFEKPWTGWGLGSSYTLPFQEPHGAMYQFVNKNASHPHNVMIQLWVELGLGGVIMGVAAALFLLREASRLPARIAPFAVGAWAASLCISFVAYSFWDDSLFALFAMTILAFIVMKKHVHN